MIGLCEFGLKHYIEAKTAFRTAVDLSRLEVVKDEVNCAVVLLNEGAYAEAEQKAKHARSFAPSYASPVTCLLSIFNRMNRHGDIEQLILEVRATQPELLSDPDLIERLANDTDLIGVSTIIESVKQRESHKEAL